MTWTPVVGAPNRVWFNGEVLAREDARIPITNQAFNYGTGVFEGIRAYTDHDGAGMNIFRLADHLTRLQKSAKLMRLDLDLSVADLTTIICELLATNGAAQDTYIRPIAYKSALLPGTGFGVRLSGVSTEFAITTVPMGDYTRRTGLRCAVSPWRRMPSSVLPAGAKITGSYVNCALAMEHAQSSGLDDALMLNTSGNLAEATTSNVFVVIDGRLVTPPSNADILPGITRRTVIELAERELGLPTDERDVQLAELYGADECFLCGTGVEVTPVIEIDHRAIGSGRVGPTTEALRGLYCDAVRGVLPQYRHWLTSVDIPNRRNGGES